MPVHECTLDGKPGYQYGEQKCYTYTPGNEAERKEAKRKAYLQQAAIEKETGKELMSQDTHVIELANLPHVPILKIGEWHPHNTKESLPVMDIDSIIEGSNECKDLVFEAMTTGVYRGNEDFKLTKPIPAVMNIHHQEMFPDTEVNDALKKAFQAVTATYQKETIDGEEWLTANFENVPNGSAETLRRHFPLRSVELIQNFSNPDTGHIWPMIIRSTAFLNQTTKPAVSGQRPELVVEFSADESPVVRLTSTYQVTQGDIAMATQTPEKKVDGVDVAEMEKAQHALTEKDQQIAELRAKLSEVEIDKESTIKELEMKDQHRDAQVRELAAKLDAKEIKELCHDLQMKPRVNKDGNHAYILSKSAMDIITPGIQGKGVFELQEGEDSRHAFINRIDALVELAAKGGLLVPMTMQGERTFDAPGQKTPDEETLVKEFMTADENLTEEQAWIKAQAALKVYQGGVQ